MKNKLLLAILLIVSTLGYAQISSFGSGSDLNRTINHRTVDICFFTNILEYYEIKQEKSIDKQYCIKKIIVSYKKEK